MTPLTPTPVIFGASRLGDRPGADELADALLASHLGHVDTSNNYAEGRSEQLLGDAVRRAGGIPGHTAIYSKADSDPVTGAFDGDRVRRSLDESLTRLGVDSLPLYQFHDPYGITFHDAMAPDGPVQALLDLRDQGVIGAIGIASGTLAQVREYVETGVFDVVLSHNRYTLVDRSAAPLFADARERGMIVFNAAPFGGGTLANNAETYGYRPMPPDFAAHVKRVRALADDHRVELAAAALHFSLRDPRVNSTVVGVPSLDRLADLARLTDTQVPDDFFAAVEDLGTPPPSAND